MLYMNTDIIMPFREVLYSERLKLQHFLVSNEKIRKDTLLYLKYEKLREETKQQINELNKRFHLYEHNIKKYKNKIYIIDFENKNLESESYIVAKSKYIELHDDLKFYEKKINSLNYNLDIYHQITIAENEIARLTYEIDEEENLLF